MAGLLPPPALGERRHRSLARQYIAVCRTLDVAGPSPHGPALRSTLFWLSARAHEADLQGFEREGPEEAFRRCYEHAAIETFHAVSRLLESRAGNFARGRLQKSLEGDSVILSHFCFAMGEASARWHKSNSSREQ